MKKKNNWYAGRNASSLKEMPNKPKIGLLQKVGDFPETYVNYYYLSLFLSKFFNSFIRSGKKNKTYKLLYRLCILVRLKTKFSSRRFFYQAMQNIFPFVALRVVHSGHVKHEVPVMATPKDQVFLSVRWIASSVKSRKERSLEDRIFNELLEIINNDKNCSSLKKKKTHYQTAFNNKPLVRYLKHINF